MSNNAKLSLGTVVKLGDAGTPETFNRLGECLSVPEIGEERPLIDVTYSDATAREYIGGIPEGMELDFEFNYDSSNTQLAALIAATKLNSNRNFQVTVPAASTKTLAFTLTCLKWGLKNGIGEQIILTFKGKVSGSVTIS